jgi:hypothetical protein
VGEDGARDGEGLGDLMSEKITAARHRHPHWAAFTDWLGVFAATTSFVFIALWAASPDSAMLTVETALLRSLSYSIPITFGMWGISRATRKGSSIPRTMAEAMPYARFGKDGKPVGSTMADDKAGNAPSALGQVDGS